ncbi:hypothetical protein PG999_004530 [Apiospora kogelbergensis]|uniref:Glycosyltransferase family 2 protein n=1 Tax=Apiospora kogelbergensis TaxID=1337665 RepID=A0AAW0QZJ5_9PEZI
MALSPYLYWPLAFSGWLSVLAAVTVTLPYLLGVRHLTNGWPLTAEKALAAFSFFRYWRFWVHGLSYCYLYKPSPIPDSPSYTADKDITVIVPTVEPGNSTFGRCLDSICANGPFRIVVITVGAAMHQMAEEALAPIRRAHPSANIEVHHTMAANKRLQIDSVVDTVYTPITFLIDSTAILPPSGHFFRWGLAPFEDPDVALVGTRKRVERTSQPTLWAQCWKFLAAIYLERHNFEVPAANAIDDGAFIISGRTCGVRTAILQNKNFRRGYSDEYIRFPFGLFPAIGPIVTDDDNYLHRFCVDQGYRVKFQSDVGTETVAASSSASDCVVGIANLGEYPRFLQQCIRWARTSFRSNPRSLLSARAWRRHPWSMYGVQLATITNFAVLGDGLQIYLYLQTAWWADGQGQWGAAWMLLTKLVKLIPWLWRYPADIVFLPAYLGFAYYHSWIKLHALLTFWNLEWAGRDLEKINDMALK